MDLPVTSGEAGDGLVPPAAAVHFFFGKGGAMMITIMLFMAITSTGSAEQIASSLDCVRHLQEVYQPEGDW